MRKNHFLCMMMRLICIVIVLVLFAGTATTSDARRTRNLPKYKIRINKQCCTVTVYKCVKGKYEPKKAMICSPGPYTPLGTFSLGEKSRWGTLMGPSYGQYCARITGRVLFPAGEHLQLLFLRAFDAEFPHLGIRADFRVGEMAVLPEEYVESQAEDAESHEYDCGKEYFH